MDLEKLKQMLETGVITQAQYEELTKETPQSQEPEQPPEQPKQELSKPDISKLIQAEVEKSLSTQMEENKRLSSQLETLKKEKLTAAERQQLERQEKERQLKEREKAVKESENRLYAVKAVKAAGLDEPEDTDLDILDFVMGENPKEIDSRVQKFKSYLEQRDKRRVEREYKAAGREPQSGLASKGTAKNPYMPETWNLTEQNKLELTNPTEATRLQSLAGIQ